jgi:transcriptional regulator with XRE-family HTH domain
MTLTAQQVKAARELLGWTRAKLSAESGVGVATIVIFENGLHPPQAGTVATLKRALEAAGLEFTNEGEPRLRLRKTKTLTGQQVKSARRLLGWTQDKLAAETRVNLPAIGHFETCKRRPSVLIVSVIQRALEDAGIEFVEGESGVRLKARP